MAPKNSRAVSREKLVVVGNGMASVRLIDEIIQAAPKRYDITVVGREPRPGYNRVLLSSLLAGESADADIELRPAAWYKNNGVRLLTGTRVTALRPLQRQIVLSSGARLPFDRLVLATGSEAIRLPVPGADLDGVATFRDLDDVVRMQGLPPAAPAVVIGGGLLGIEAAYGLKRRGHPVTLVHIMPRLMERQLDARAAVLLAAALERLGIAVRLEAQTQAIRGARRVEAVELRGGDILPASLVVMAAGVGPAASLAETGGVAVGRGIKVDDKLETNWPGVYALGECAEHRGVCYGLVEPAYEQARVLATYLAGRPALYSGSTLATNLKVSGVPVFSIGDFEGAGAEIIRVEDEAAATYRRLAVRDGRLVGAVLFGDTSDAQWYRDLVRSGAPLDAVRSALAFGRAFAEAA